MHATRLLLTLLLALSTLTGVAATTEAQAQTLELPRKRQGYYLGGGLDFGASHFVEDGHSRGNWFTQMSKWHAGQMLTEHLGLGLSLELGSASRKSEQSTLVGLGTEGQWELLPNLALHAGFGFGVASLSDNDDPNAELRGSYGGRYLLAVSYDWFPGKPKGSGGFSIQPVATVRMMPNDPVSATIFTLGLRFNYWKGLPKNELELPPGEGYEK